MEYSITKVYILMFFLKIHLVTSQKLQSLL